MVCTGGPTVAPDHEESAPHDEEEQGRPGGRRHGRRPGHRFRHRRDRAGRDADPVPELNQHRQAGPARSGPARSGPRQGRTPRRPARRQPGRRAGDQARQDRGRGADRTEHLPGGEPADQAVGHGVPLDDGAGTSQPDRAGRRPGQGSCDQPEGRRGEGDPGAQGPPRRAGRRAEGRAEDPLGRGRQGQQAHPGGGGRGAQGRRRRRHRLRRNGRPPLPHALTGGPLPCRRAAPSRGPSVHPDAVRAGRARSGRHGVQLRRPYAQS